MTGQDRCQVRIRGPDNLPFCHRNRALWSATIQSLLIDGQFSFFLAKKKKTKKVWQFFFNFFAWSVALVSTTTGCKNALSV